MKIFAVSVVKNEADIIEYSLKKASEWADKIFVIDNGSEDNTWKIVNSIKNDIIIPFKQDIAVFSNDMRADIFNSFKHLTQKNDWWCFRLDADEVYFEDVKKFLFNVPHQYDWVCKKSIDYQFTHENLHSVNIDSFDTRSFRYFSPTSWVERRFFRFHPCVTWNRNAVLPNLGLTDCVYEKTIIVKHYQYRSVEQIKRRIRDRIKAKSAEPSEWEHINPDLVWESYIRRKEELIEGDNESAFFYAQPSFRIKNNTAKLLLNSILTRIR